MSSKGAYKFRNLPCNIVPVNQLWCVAGRYQDASGVLEWCYHEDDARHQMDRMQAHGEGFEGLYVSRWES